MIDVELIESLGKPEDSSRRYAAQEISESGDAGAVAVLMAQLQKETSRAVKEAILRGLSHIWSFSPFESLIVLLKDADPFVRAEAAEMLQRRAGEAMESLNRLLEGDDKDLRKFSIDILSQTGIGVPEALYTAALKDEDINVVISAIESLGAGRRTAFAAPILAIALASSQPMAICACLEALAQIGNRQSLEALRARFPDASQVPGIYLHSFVKLLGGTGGEETIAEICELMGSKGAPVYEVAIDALTRVAVRHRLSTVAPLYEDVLCNLLKEPLAARIRLHLIRLLGHFARSARVAHALLPYLDDPDRMLGLAAVEALEASADPLVERSLLSLATTENDPEILEEIEELLRRRPRWNSPPSNTPS